MPMLNSRHFGDTLWSVTLPGGLKTEGDTRLLFLLFSTPEAAHSHYQWTCLQVLFRRLFFVFEAKFIWSRTLF